MKKYYMIGNTHFDPVWLWRWDEAMASIRATFRSALDRMRETDDFIYSFATPPVFEWIKHTDPEMFEEIRQRVEQGRWELAEGWWVQPDCYSASGESYIRQGLYGQRWLQENFGQQARCVFNIDSFGHSPMLPQILHKCGIEHYCFCRPESKHIKLEQQLFRWKSRDGSEVKAYRVEAAYEKDWRDSTAKQPGEADALIVYGVTDHGGAPTKKAIAEICAAKDAEFSTVDRFFQEHNTDFIFDGELITGDFGPYSNYSRIKKRNRMAEYALLNAEKAALFARHDQQSSLREAWQTVLFNQFHDIMGGACIKDAYEDAENQLGGAIARANEVMHYALQSITRQVNMPGKNPDNAWNCVVWNLNSSPYDGYHEAEVQWMHEFDWYDGGICLEDAVGNRIPCQIIREKSVIPRFRTRFIFRAKIPAMGYRAFKVIQEGERGEPLPYQGQCIDTGRLVIAFSPKTGFIQSITDCTGKKLVEDLLVPVVYDDPGDTWCFNIDRYNQTPRYFHFEGFSVIESGELFTELKACYRLDDSKIEMYYRFYADMPEFDLRYRVNWEGRHQVLKLEIPVHDHCHTVAVPGGEIDRGENPADVPMGAWIRTGSMTIAADSIFAYSMADSKLGLTLLRSPIYGDLRIGSIDTSLDYDIIDRGIVEGKIRVHFGEERWELAERLCNPPVIIDESNHSGNLPSEQSFCRISTPGVSVTALKRSEDGDAAILRLAEQNGISCRAQVIFQDRVITAELSPWEIKTLRLTELTVTETDMLEQ